MAQRPDAVTRRFGIAAAFLVVAAIVLACVGIATRVEAGSMLGPGDWAAIRFTIVQSALSAVFSVVLAIPLARALARRRFVGRDALVMLLGAPFILPVIVAVLGLVTVFGRSGWVNVALGTIGLPGVSVYGLHGVVLAHVFFNLPLATRLLLQGWAAIPSERFRLTAQLRLSPRAVFRAVEGPMLRQVVPGALALVFVICLTSFAVALTLGGGPKATTIELAIYQAFKFDFDLGRAARLSVVQLVMAGGIALLALRLVPTIRVGGGLDRARRRWDAPQGWRRWSDSGVIALGAGFLLLPLAAVVLRGVAGLPQMPGQVYQAVWVSLGVSVGSILVMLALALPMAGLIAGRSRGGIEAVGLLGLSASPLMIGTGWFILINPVADPRLFALPVTMIVNAMMSLPFALRILVPPMRDTLQVYGRLSNVLGMRGWPLWRWLILPRLRAQIGFAAGLTGALSMGDLGVIALFADQDRVTLPLQMYRLMGAYRMEAAAGAALLLLALSLGIFWICDKGGRWNADT
ncbi:thiamine/thiamine pyrophosphate ABC transporter permease ThiP [Sulfitobacter sp. SK012]|uniref:thiamine/thiamine pyrophosphate ABC transporter permease ThiP n=1 Tax=Sulfitobacter sp. SK012 TaxID=1389005 RepID=UPI000E0C1A76|nr:thiamine/thiamine pyrophosphate ABC transporter permease ThiP [Sulfitobacter sp. SK012]AXI48424.1 thiamine/thiamine pyrophosphate ABC transporter permease ThiP [Sulfitobacter sp. SK012]